MGELENLKEQALALGLDIFDGNGKPLSVKKLREAIADAPPPRKAPSTPPPAQAMPARRKAPEAGKKRYRLRLSVMLDGIEHPIGSVVEMTDAQAAPIPYALEPAE